MGRGCSLREMAAPKALLHSIYSNPLFELEREVVGGMKSLFGKMFGK